MSKQPSIWTYVTGGLIGNIPLLFLLFMLNFVFSTVFYKPTVEIYIYVTIFIGAVLAGYIVTRTVKHQHPIIGLVTGASCYLFNVIFSTFFPQFFFLELLKEYFLFMFYVVGGIFGGFLRQKIKIK